jgi:PAS domain S-box-containing protein
MRRRVFLGAVALSAVITFIFGMDALRAELAGLQVIDLSVSVISLGILWAAYRRPHSTVPNRVFVSVMASFFIYLFASGGHGGTGLLFMLLIPLAAPLFLGWKHGMAVALISMLVCVGLVVIGGNISSPLPGVPENTVLARAGAIYVASLILSGLYDFAMQKAYREETRAKEALRQSEERYRTILDEMGDGYFETDLAGNLTLANDAQIRLLGCSREETIGMNYRAFTPAEQVKAVSEAYDRMYRTGEPLIDLSADIMREDGSRGFAEISAFPIRSDKGEIAGFRGVCRDITERKRMEEALTWAAEEWRETFDSISDAVSICSTDCRLLRANKAFADMFHTERGKIVDKYCYEIMHGLNEPVSGCPHLETLKTSKPAGAEFFEPHLGMYLELTTSPIFDDKGAITGIVHVARDITEHKRQEEQLMMADRLASIGELAAGTAHELNNPLTSVIGFSRLLMEKDVSDDIREDLGIICSEAQRATEVVKQLLQFARRHTPLEQLNQINSVIEHVLRLRAYEQKAHNIEVRRDLAPALPEIMVDYFQMQQVLLNIIINAEQSMVEANEGGTLTIATRRRNSTVVISVTDDGLGISQEHLGQIFNPFFTTKKAGKGTGLGLSICQRIVAEHSGQIYARSRPGEGATFHVELPINGARPSKVCHETD